MSSLDGQRVAILEARRASELANLLSRHGAIPIHAPALREVSVDAAPVAQAVLQQLEAGQIELLILLTGVGTQQLIDAAASLELEQAMLAALANTTLVCRGPKPTAVLRRYGLRPSISAASPYTINDLINSLDQVELAGRGVGLLHYGERDRKLADYCLERGAVLHEQSIYEWQLPADLSPLDALIEQAIAGQIAIFTFTSQIQVRHLLQVAEQQGQAHALIAAMQQAIVAAVGPSCAQALINVGIHDVIMPEQPFMGQMVQRILNHVSINS
ncbi:uroporphyrinogen-III synthase [Herpetosiphon sp. NSE202]|uniref:uroporphyrinogen-III synthase n=1 Tax=Herpetosiphon sp. NSE202 TaxID=3351349 RepID=UPI003629552A